MTVYVVCEIDQGISEARNYGDIQYVNHRYVNGDELEQGTSGDLFLPSSFESNIRAAVNRFDWKNDFLLIAGDHLQLMAVMIRLGAKFPRIHVLRYDRRERKYIPVWLSSGLVPVADPVLGSTSQHIGREHGKKRTKNSPEHQAWLDPLRDPEPFD